LPDTATIADTPPPALGPTPIDLVRPDGPPALFRHTKRSVWGLGTVTLKLDDRVRMQFQDGRTRTFKQGYYHLLDVVDRPLDVTLSIVGALRSMIEETTTTTTSSRGPLPPSLEEQIAYLRELFPGGFQDEAYASEQRGDGRKRPLKRHRDALVERAAEHLSRRAMLKLLTVGDYSGVHAAAVSVVTVTNLVPAKERKAFADISEEHHMAVANSLQALLHGTSPDAVRFDGFVATLERTMGQTPSWGLATVLLGAVNPKKYVVVKQNVLSKQTTWMAPGLSISDRPMGILYERLQAMTEKVEAKLREAGLSPRDLLDVHDFMWLTLKPAARTRILDLRFEHPNGRLPIEKAEGEADVVAA